jgi:hypothetical protein
VRRVQYQGGFEHPLRAFLIGISLLVLLFGGFAVGIEAGTHPLESTDAARTVREAAVRTVTVQQPVVSTVIKGNGKVVRLPGSTTTQVVVVHRGGRTLFGYLTPASTSQSGEATPASTVYLPAPEGTTVTETTTSTETVTEPPVTVTVTETAPPTTTDTGSGASTAP